MTTRARSSRGPGAGRAAIKPSAISDYARGTGEEIGIYDIVGRNIARLRKERGWSQEQFHKLVQERGIPWSLKGISMIERGKQLLHCHDLTNVAELFGVPLWKMLDPDADLVTVPLRVGPDVRPAWAYVLELLESRLDADPECRFDVRCVAIANELYRRGYEDDAAGILKLALER